MLNLVRFWQKMTPYRNPKWIEYREEVFRLDGYTCVKCNRSKDAGAILQVHHKAYSFGKQPWDYPYERCETLCKRCHATEHGHLRPTHQWECIGDDDLGDLSGECDLCGSQLRYVFFVVHQKWPGVMEVGTSCCDHLTGTQEASEMQRYRARLKRFASSARWVAKKDDGQTMHHMGYEISIMPESASFYISIDGFKGKKRFHSTLDAKISAFHLLESGKIEEFFSRIQKRQKNS